MKKTIMRILTLLLVVLGLGIGEAMAEDNVKYADADGVEQTKNGVTVLTGNLNGGKKVIMN